MSATFWVSLITLSDCRCSALASARRLRNDYSRSSSSSAALSCVAAGKSDAPYPRFDGLTSVAPRLFRLMSSLLPILLCRSCARV